MAGGPGFEPGLEESESTVLPLNYPPTNPPDACGFGPDDEAKDALSRCLPLGSARNRRNGAGGQPPSGGRSGLRPGLLSPLPGKAAPVPGRAKEQGPRPGLRRSCVIAIGGS
jgi:hypothetical protein